MKRLVIVIFIIFASFLTFSLYRTFAYDTSAVEKTPSTTDLEYTFKIGNSSIKQITVDSGETKYFDVVLGNPNPAKISYGVYYEMVSPTTKPDNFKIEYTSKSTGDSTGIVNNNGNITLNIVVTNTSSNAVTVKVGTVAGYVKGGELLLGSGQVVIPKRVFPDIATEYVKSLDIGSTGDSGSGVYKVEHSLIPASSSATGSEIPAVTDYRYYGASPNNYICLDMEGGSTCPDKHLYRIIGSIYEELEGANRLKVIKATPLTDGTTKGFVWDLEGNVWATPTNGNYSNSLTSGSQLMKLLNSGLWWNGTSGSYNNDSTPATNVNFTNYKLSDKAKSYISTSRYYLVGPDTDGLKTPSMYLNERSNLFFEEGMTSYWDGMIGLMYSSDYGYAAGNNCFLNTNLDIYDLYCKDINWLYNSQNFQWFITSTYTYQSYAYCTYNDEGIRVLICLKSSIVAFVSPTFYLTSSTLITSGDGSIDNPYLIGL